RPMTADSCAPEHNPASGDPEPIIRLPTALDTGRPRGVSRMFVIGCILAVLMHVYTGILLTAVLDVTTEEEVVDKNLENDEIGNGPDLPTNYNVDRIEDVDVPGPVNPNEAPGTAGDPNNPPVPIPLPPGFGGNLGQAGGIDVPQAEA